MAMSAVRVTGRFAVLVALGAASTVGIPGTPAVAATGGTVFSYTGAEQTYTVPDGVTEVQVVAVGGPGGASQFGNGASFGGVATADLAVTPGQALIVEVGGAGGKADNLSATSGAGGWNGGATGFHSGFPKASGGGGASDVRTLTNTDPNTLGSRVVVAGGGGGAGGNAAMANPGGAGGAAGSGGQVTPYTCSSQDGCGGGGATTIAAGIGGYSNGAQSGISGTLGSGGAGGNDNTDADGGGGGGGWYGGGGGGTANGGGNGGGGGGGSSWFGSGTSNTAAAIDTTGTPSVTIKAFWTLTVTATGTGAGTVTDDASQVSCPTSCTGSYLSGTSVTLTAAAATGSTFAGWTGSGCSGLGTCVVSVDAFEQVTAQFDRDLATLTVLTTGSGSGTVTDDAAQLTCPGTCMADYPTGTAVTLTAQADSGSVFGGWSGGGCSGTGTGTGTCQVTMNTATAVAAEFVPAPLYTLTVARNGAGSGTVSGNGISCGKTCSTFYNSGTHVSLTAKPATGSSFSGWSGDCTGTKACSLTMSASRHISATFTRLTPTTKLDSSKIQSSKHQATFRFSSNDARASFECAASRQSTKVKFTSCQSPKTYKHLTAGNYLFEVRAIGKGGRDKTPVKKPFSILATDRGK